jgi:hypothetical protein
MEGWTDGSVTISLRNFVGEGIIMSVLSVSTHIITNIRLVAILSMSVSTFITAVFSSPGL